MAAESLTRRTRIESIDLVRGIIIVIMALDHVHDFFGDFAARPTDLSSTTAALFFTRWVTHISAPVFFLLTGTTAPPGWDVGLPLIYLIWIGVVAALYPLCRWFADVRQRRRDWWLSYL